MDADYLLIALVRRGPNGIEYAIRQPPLQVLPHLQVVGIEDESAVPICPRRYRVCPCLGLPYELRGLDAQSLRQLPHSPGMGPLPAVLYAPDRVVGDATPLLQLPQGENLLSPQFLKPLHVDLHARYFALLSSQNITTISR